METWKIVIQGQPGQKVHKTPILTNDQAQWHMPVNLSSPAMQNSTNKKIIVLANLGINARLYLKNN
jgi:hypothetical protein